MCCQHHQTKDEFSRVLTDVRPLWRRIAHAKALDTTLALAFTITWSAPPAPVIDTAPERERETVAV